MANNRRAKAQTCCSCHLSAKPIEQSPQKRQIITFFVIGYQVKKAVSLPLLLLSQPAQTGPGIKASFHVTTSQISAFT